MRSSDPRARIAAALPKAVAAAQQQNRKRATLGWQKSDTEIVVDAPGGQGALYITWAHKGTRGIAYKRANIPLSRNLPVLIERIAEANYIVDIDWSNPAAVLAVLNNAYGVFPHPLDGHSDVTAPAPDDGDLLYYDGLSEQWVNVPAATAVPAPALGDLSDTVIIAPFDGDALTYEAGEWVNTDRLPEVVATSIDAATELTAPAGSSFAVTLSGVLRWISYTNLLAALQAAFLTFTNQIAIVATATTGSALRVVRDLTAASTDAPVVDIVQDHASDDQAALRVRQDGSGNVATLTGSDGSTIVDRFGNFSATGVNATAGINGTGVVSLRISKTDGSGHDWRIEQQRNTTNGSLEINDVADLGNSRVVIGPTGDVGIGVTAPQGRLQVHDGNGGMMFVTKTGIVGTPITVIPDGLGDVVRGVKIDGVAYNTVPQTRGFDITVPVSGSGEVDALGTGVNVLTFAVSAGGALTVSRTAGSATWEFAANLKWL